MFLIVLLFSACNKDPLFIPENQPPNYNNVPGVKIENYINRLYIDLLGREPLNIEMQEKKAILKDSALSMNARIELIQELQFDTTWVEGDSSYFIAYHRRFYDLVKVRMIEGASDAYIQSRINNANFSKLQGELLGDSARVSRARDAIERLQNVLNIQYEYRIGEITLNEVFSRLANNQVFDVINMGTLNFVNACFDNLYFRFPTQFEFEQAWEMLENNQSVYFLGSNGSNKDDFLEIITHNNEFYIGMIRWMYLQLLSREPTSTEIVYHNSYFYPDANLYLLQQEILKTDEYAKFN